jgi:hypothetical protein
MSEIKIKISEESRKQVQEMNDFLGKMKGYIDDLQGATVNVSSFKEAGKAAVENKKQLTELENAQLKLTKARTEEGKELVKVRAETAALNAETRRQAKAAADGTIEYSKLRAELKQLQSQAKELAITEGETSKAFIEKSNQARELAERLREVDKATGDNTSSIGDYNAQILGALQQTGLFGGAIAKVTKAKQAAEQAYKGANGALMLMSGTTTGVTKAIKVFNLTLAASGIGLFVAALGLVITSMMKMQPVIDAVNKVLTPLANTMQRMVGIAQEFGNTLIGIFKGEKSFKDLGDVIKNAGDNLNQAWKEGQRLAEITVQLRKLAIEQVRVEAELRDIKADQRRILDDQNKSLSERKAAGDAYIEAVKQEKALQGEILDLQIEQLEIKQAQNATTDDELLQLARLKAERQGLNSEVLEETRRIQNQINGIIKQQAEEDRKRKEQIAEINRDERQALKFKLDAKLKELRLNGDISKLTAEELSARNKLIADYEKALSDLDKAAEMSLLTRVNGLLQEKQQLDQNITALEKWAETADPEMQAQINKELDFYREKLTDINAELERSGALLPEYANAQALVTKAVKDSEKAYAELEAAIEAQFRNGELSAEEYYKAIGDARDNFLNDTIDNTVSLLQDILNREDISADERLKIEEDLAKAKKAVRDRELDDIKAKIQAEIDEEMRKEELKKMIIDQGFQLATNLANEFATRNQERLALELSQFKENNAAKLESDIALATEQGATQEELEAIKARGAAELAAKENEIRRQQAQAEKRKAIFDSLINTSRAAVQALPNIPLSIAIGIQGAIQTALIASRPIPQFAKGVRNFEGGMAVVGEAGREIVSTPNGSFLADRPMLTYLPTGTDVYNNRDTQRMLSDKSLPLLKQIAKKNMTANVNVIVKDNSYVNWAFRR